MIVLRPRYGRWESLVKSRRRIEEVKTKRIELSAGRLWLLDGPDSTRQRM